MTNLGTNLKLSAVFVVFFVSVLGCIIPILLAKRSPLQDILARSVFMTMKCVATGVVLGVATMHLLPDAIETLESQAEYPRKCHRMCPCLTLR